MLELFHEGEFYRYGPHSRDLGAGWAEVELHHVGTVDSESLGWVPVEDDE